MVLRLAAGEPGRVLVVQTAYLGDVVFTSPLVRALRARFARATIVFCATPKGCAIARCIPGVDAAVPFDKRGADRALGLFRVARALRPVDVAVAAHRSPRTALLVAACRPAVAVGFNGLVGRAVYDRLEPDVAAESFPERVLRLGRALGADGPTPLWLAAPPGALAAADRFLGGRPALALAIGSEWGSKRWPPERFAQVADAAARRGLASVLCGAPAERALADRVLAAAERPEAIKDAVGWDLGDTLGLLARSRAVLGGDTGLVHAARALGVPAVALFGPTDPRAHLFEPTTRALTVGVPCQPCHPHGPPACPLGHHDCMKKLSADAVFGALASAAGLR